jgi:ABC-type amino acid transport substrate-binding protein
MLFIKVMKNFISKINVVLLIITLYSINVEAEELQIALGNFKPLFSAQNSPALFKDLIDGVYAYLPQYNVNYHYMVSNSRLTLVLNENLVDGAANIFSKTEIKGCITQPIFGYSDVAVTLKSAQHNIQSINDLSSLSLVSYQGAKTLLGEKYSQVVRKIQYYQEIANPTEQAKLLNEGMVDVSIGDKYIFLDSLNDWSKGEYNVNKYQFHHIFPPVYSSMGFNKQKHCDDFDLALNKFKSSGDYDNVYKKHLERLGYQKQVN